MEKLLQLIVVAVAFLHGCGLQAQDVNFTIRYNSISSEYEVYGTPDFDDPFFFVGGGSQLTVVLPDSVGDSPFAITTINGGIWVDNSQIYAPAADPIHDFHGIASNGSSLIFANDQELLLFTFSLPGDACLPGIRLFENDSDPQSNAPGMGGGDFNNFFANVFTFQDTYHSNYTSGPGNCPAPPEVITTPVIISQDSTANFCLPIVDNNAGDTFDVNVCPGSSTNGVVTTYINNDELCLSYSSSTGFTGTDEICLVVCDQTGLCDTAIVTVMIYSGLCFGNDASGDTDGDGYCDDLDNCPDVANFTQADCDNDGIGDPCESDGDGDGIPDDCDLCVGDDASGDTDGDGICDNIDNCVSVSNPNQADCDNDGQGDICEADNDNDGVPDDCDLCFGNDAIGDTDGDGYCNDTDNCTTVANPDQADCDNDGEGDVCETDSDGDTVPDDCDICFGDDAVGDTDGDGYCDDIDNCIAIANPDQADCDNDNEGDICETDNDDDGVPDGCDICFGDDATGDDDNDGICNDVEYCNSYQIVASNDGTECVQPFTDVNLYANIVGANLNPDDFVFSWTGENGFSSSMQNPILPNIENDDSGTYTVTVTNTLYNCEDISSTVVDVTLIPDEPQITASTEEVCIGSELLLSIDDYSGTEVHYEWSGPNGSTSDGAYPDEAELLISNFDSTDAGTYEVWVIVDRCTSMISVSVDILIRPPLNAPEIIAANQFCENGVIQLESGTVADEYHWSGPNGFSSDLPIPAVTNLAGTQHAGVYSLIVVKDGCTSPPASVTISISNQPSVPILEVNSDICEGEDIVLSIIGSNATSYQWIAPSASPNSNFGTLGDPDNVIWTNEPNTIISLADHPEFYEAGSWRVQAINAEGCVSMPAVPVDLRIYELPEEVIAFNEGNVCERSPVYLHVNEVQDAEYRWFEGDPYASPAGTLIATGKAPILYNLSPGLYQFFVEIAVNGCLAEDLGQTEVLVTKTPEMPVISNSGPYCQGDSVYLLAPEIADATYYWYGPDGYVSNEQNPILPNASTEEAGTYLLFVAVNGCPSLTTSTQVAVNARPLTPEVSHNGPLCIGESLQLNGPPPSGSFPAVYEWTGPDNFTSSEQNPLIPNASPVQSGLYNLVMVVDGCSSLAGTSGQVNIVELPQVVEVTSNASAAVPVCDGDVVQLNTPYIDGATYSWIGPNGFVSDLHNPTILNASLLDTGNYRLVISAGSCISEPAVTRVFINDAIEVPIATNNGPVCEGSDLLLSITNPDPLATYEWFDSTGNISIGVGADLLFENVGAQMTGTYYVIATINNCNSDPSQMTNAGEDAFSEVWIEVPVADAAYVGNPLFACDNKIEIAALEVSSGTGNWSVLNGGPNTTILQPGEATTLVTELQAGITQLLWSVSSNSCGITSSDTLFIEHGLLPEVEDDVFEIEFNETLNDMDILRNDRPNTAEYELKITSEVSNGQLLELADHTFLYDPNQGFVGTDSFEYQICHRFCPELCSEGTVVIRVAVGVECEAASVMTPNEDGYNDTFIIPCVLNHPRSSLSVFNRWGDEVYFNSDYRNEWGGTYQEEKLPTGTYFYHLNLNDGNQTKMTGYIYLER